MNRPENPICICDVYPDRLIALQAAEEIVGSCGHVQLHPDGSHDSPACNCTAANGTRSKWVVPGHSLRHIGRSPVWLPYFYYQLPMAAYPGRRHIGSFYSTPAGGRCQEGDAVGTGGCTWRRLPQVRVLYPTTLLQHGWNATPSSHWPLRVHGPNTTEQTMQNIGAFMRAKRSAQAGWLTPRCCGC